MLSLLSRVLVLSEILRSGGQAILSILSKILGSAGPAILSILSESMRSGGQAILRNTNILSILTA